MSKWTDTYRPTADNGEYVEVDERRNSDNDVQKTFLPVVQPHQYPPTRAATAAVVSVPHSNHAHGDGGPTSDEKHDSMIMTQKPTANRQQTACTFTLHI